MDAKVSAGYKMVSSFLQQYPEDASRILDTFSIEESKSIVLAQSTEVITAILPSLNPDLADDIVMAMGSDLFKSVFIVLNPDKGLRLLSRIDNEIREQYLDYLPNALAKEYRELIAYPPDTAGNLMDPRVAVFKPDQTAGNVLEHVRKIKDRRILDICVTGSDDHLVAVIPLHEIAFAEPNQQLAELHSGEPVCIPALAPKEDVVNLLDELKLTSLAVIDIEGRLLGIIRYSTLVSAAKQEVSEDLQAMFGAGRDERALSKISFAVRKRLGWLEINLGTAFLAAMVVGLFEDTIARFTALAIFLPVVAGQSGNTGAQALVVTMRGLVLREVRIREWKKIFRKEITVGFINGVVIALTTSLIAYIWMKSAGLSLIIGIAMIFSMVIAGMAGAVIPLLLKAVGQDPAQSSSIILTTVTDIVGFFSFLGLATIFARILGAA